MNIYISGCTFEGDSKGVNNVVVVKGNNNVIVNGRILNRGDAGKRRKIDEKKLVNVEGIERITIISSVFDINIFSSESSKIEAKCYGELNIDGEVELKTYVTNQELKIALIMYGNCYDGNLRFDVIVPRKMFKRLAAQSVSANIKIDKDVSAETIKAETKSGNIVTLATFNNAFLDTISGNIRCFIEAISNIRAKFSTTSGDVSAEFAKVEKVNLFARSVSGDIENLHRAEKGYIADVKVTTGSGDIQIK